MKTVQFAILIGGLSLFGVNSEANSWDFQFGYQDVFSPNALDYVVQQQNIERSSEGGNPADGVSYWNPINNGTEAILTQEFTFPGATTEVFLNDGSEPVYNFGGGDFGTQSVWASTDGVNWIQLVNLPPPSGISDDYFYSADLPSSLLGSDQIWIQDRMETSGLNIMAQYLRQDTSANPNDIFDLDANYSTSPAPDDSSTAFLVAIALASVFSVFSKMKKNFAL